MELSSVTQKTLLSLSPAPLLLGDPWPDGPQPVTWAADICAADSDARPVSQTPTLQSLLGYLAMDSQRRPLLVQVCVVPPPLMLWSGPEVPARGPPGLAVELSDGAVPPARC